MAKIDIRAEDKPIDEIIFGSDVGYDDAYKLTKGTYICIESNDSSSMNILNKDVPYLIKALQKAVELGWTK